MEAFFVTLEADGDGDGVTLGTGSGSSSSGGCSNASDFDDEGTGLGTEVFDSETGKGGGGGVTAWACWAATRSGLMRGFLVEVPFRTSHIEHLKASALFLKVQTLQSQVPSSASEAALAFAEVRFRLKYCRICKKKRQINVCHMYQGLGKRTKSSFIPEFSNMKLNFQVEISRTFLC